METHTLPTPASDRQSTLIARLAQFFREHPNTWIDGRQLAIVGGAYAWRSRISDLRRSPFFMRIENRQRRRRGSAGGAVVSEYLFQPAVPAAPTHNRSLPF